MENDRFRIPVENEYLQALGLALYAFARLEWDAVWCCERMGTGYIHALNRKTGGDIAKDFLTRARRRHDVGERKKFIATGKWFLKLVETRNGIMHGNPASDADGTQRLFRKGAFWTIESLNKASDDFTACSILFNSYLYGALKNPVK